MRKRASYIFAILLILPFITTLPTPSSSRPIKQKVISHPLSFIPNEGQQAKEVKFYIPSSSHSFFFTDQGIVYSFRDQTEASVIRENFVGSNSLLKVNGTKAGEGTVNYFVGNDSKKWKTNLPTYSEIKYENLYPGIDMVVSGKKGTLKSEYHVRKGSDYRKIMLAYEGIDSLTLSDVGDLVISSKDRSMKAEKPYSYQVIDGKTIPVEGEYVIQGKAYGFRMKSFDPNYPLIIDPSVVYSTYIGGTDEDTGDAITVDSAGNAYVVGSTISGDFPTTSGVFQAQRGNNQRLLFIVKFDVNGQRIFATYLGGQAIDLPEAIAVDSSQNIYVTGVTSPVRFGSTIITQTNYPTTQGAFQTTFGGERDAFLTKLNSTGSALVYSTFLGGTGDDEGIDLAVDVSGNAYVAGRTNGGFPTQSAVQPNFGGGLFDGFIAKVNSTGTDLVYSTFLGGNDQDFTSSVAIDSNNDLYVTGFTASTDFATSVMIPAGINPSTSSGDCFVSKVNASGNALVYLTRVGGQNRDICRDIAVDSDGRAYVTGVTNSSDLFVTPSSPQPTFVGGGANGQDALLFLLNESGSEISYSTYLGGNDNEEAEGIAIDAIGHAYMTGATRSSDFPTSNALQPDLRGTVDAFITKIDPVTKTLVYSSYFGGQAGDGGKDIAVDRAGNVLIVGTTTSSNLATPGAFLESRPGGANDAFLAKFDLSEGLAVISTDPLNGATNVPVDTVITATFNQPIDPATLNSSSFTVSEGVTGTISFDEATRTAQFVPSAPLGPSVTFTATLTTAIQDLFGDSLDAPFTWTFTTTTPGDVTPIEGECTPDPSGSAVISTDCSDGDDCTDDFCVPTSLVSPFKQRDTGEVAPLPSAIVGSCRNLPRENCNVSTPPIPSCGDGQVDANLGETCDPPNTTNCDVNCRTIVLPQPEPSPTPGGPPPPKNGTCEVTAVNEGDVIGGRIIGVTSEGEGVPLLVRATPTSCEGVSAIQLVQTGGAQVSTVEGSTNPDGGRLIGETGAKRLAQRAISSDNCDASFLVSAASPTSLLGQFRQDVNFRVSVLNVAGQEGESFDCTGEPRAEAKGGCSLTLE